MRITSSPSAMYERTSVTSLGDLADERREKSLTIAAQIDRARQEIKVSALLTRDSTQAAVHKAAVLKQRLERLKAMMRFASPAMAKSLARELKSIAHELASIGRAASEGGAATASTASAPAGGSVDDPAATAQAADSTAAAAADAGASAATGDAAPDGGGQDADEEAGEAGSGDQTEGGGITRAGTDNASLREIVQEARKLLKELIARVKSLARAGNADTRREVRAAEDSVAELDRALDANGSLMTASDADGAATPAVGGNIDVSV